MFEIDNALIRLEFLNKVGGIEEKVFIKIDLVERCAGHGGTFGVMKKTHYIAKKVGIPTATRIAKKNNKYLASECPLAGKHLKQLEQDTNITNNEAIHPIEILAKAYKLI